MGELPGWESGDLVTLLAEVKDDRDDLGLIHLNGRIDEVAEQGDGVKVLVAVLNGLPPKHDLDSPRRLWFQGSDFLNHDLGRPEVFIRDYLGEGE